MAETRTAFDEELEEVRSDVLRLADLAAEAIRMGTAALLDFDLALALGTVEGDLSLDDLTADIQERVHRLLARQQPVAVDMRTLVTTLRVIHELERIGDLMVDVAKAVRRLYPLPLTPDLRELIGRMGDQATLQLSVAMVSFAERDPARAGALVDMDDVMDDLQKELFRVIFGMDPRTEASIAHSVQVALVGRYYERVADHAVNIGERVAYMVTGGGSGAN